MDRRSLLEILDAGLRAADGRRCVRDCLIEERPAGPIHLIAVGKCASAMAAGATDALGKDIVDGLIVTRRGYAGGHCVADARFRVLEASHPVPDESSLAAGECLMAYVGALPRGAPRVSWKCCHLTSGSTCWRGRIAGSWAAGSTSSR